MIIRHVDPSDDGDIIAVHGRRFMFDNDLTVYIAVYNHASGCDRCALCTKLDYCAKVNCLNNQIQFITNIKKL